MSKMLLWVEFENETILEAITEVNKKEKELAEAVSKLRMIIEQNAKATPACGDAGEA